MEANCKPNQHQIFEPEEFLRHLIDLFHSTQSELSKSGTADNLGTKLYTR
ncbi:AAEL006130-PA [Aedes aegypti]|uniref:AAEL006130-PA n=1 Tax=Aedes aegypti TaxID=7159 RepID=Q177H5_AEDAE|nr:AAEL006130-PA [Aedes aegypti]